MAPVSYALIVDAHHVARKLAPAKRDLSNERRGLPDADFFMPRSSVILDYGHGSHYSPKATVSFTAYSEHPIVLIETFDGLLSSVSCGTGAIDLHFLPEDATREAASSWTNFKTFRAVTSHPGCNLDDERGAWSVYEINADVFSQKISLFVEPLPLKDIGQFFEVSYGHKNIASSWTTKSAGTIGRRDDTFSQAYNNDFSGIQIFPGNSSAGGLAEAVLNQLTGSSVEVLCVDCASNFNFTVDMNFNVTAADLTVNAASLSANIETFEQSVVLDVSMNLAISATPSFDFLNIPIPGLAVAIPGIFSFGPSIGMGVSFELDMNGPLNFTMGAKGSIPSGATASVDFLQQKVVKAKGWDGAKVESVPFRVNSGQLNTTLGAALAPFIELGVTVGGKFGVQARITQNAPHMTLSSTLSSQVNRECKPIGDNDFESFDTAYLMTAGMSLQTIAKADLDLSVITLKGIAQWNNTLFQKDLPFLNGSTKSNPTAQQCYIIANDNAAAASAAGSNGTDPAIVTLQAAPSGTILAAAFAVPTFNMPKIESYYSAKGHLPTGVNYKQLAQATTVPDSLKSAVQKAASTAVMKASLRDGIVMCWFATASALYMVLM
ncbi:hypothetical protein BDZ97DRAFT_1923351 [Flammula alnicola]|nr:hypothetical protein BDZ97DRAFT_1923351 [Flammula alnicola]